MIWYQDSVLSSNFFLTFRFMLKDYNVGVFLIEYGGIYAVINISYY